MDENIAHVPIGCRRYANVWRVGNPLYLMTIKQ